MIQRDRCKVDVTLNCELLPLISSSASPVNIATFNICAHVSNLPVRVTLIGAQFRATISESTRDHNRFVLVHSPQYTSYGVKLLDS